MINCGIYQIVNTINNKSYIGSSKDICSRVSVHFSKLRTNNHHSPHLQNAYNKYGVDNFKVKVLFSCPKSELIRLEQYHLDNYQPEYNVSKIAGSTISTTFKPVVLLSIDGNTELRFPSLTEASIFLGCPKTNVYTVCNNIIISVCGFFVFYEDEYTIENIQKKKLLKEQATFIRKNIFNSKKIPILKFSKKGEFICEYSSASDAGRDINHDISAITACCKGKIKSAGGYCWKYKNIERND